MVSTKFSVEKFDGKNDFSLWRVKMGAFLVYKGIVDALRGNVGRPDGWEDIDWQEAMDEAHSSIILCLGDKVLRKVSKEQTTTGVWTKLEFLYMTKSLANRLYLKKKLYTFQMQARKSISMEDVTSALNSRELKNSGEIKEEPEGFNVREKRLKKDCPDRKQHKQEGNTSYYKPLVNYSHLEDSSCDGYESSDVLVVSSKSSRYSWILDSGCSYHMTPVKSLFREFKDRDLGSVKLGDSRPCRITGIGTVEVRLSNGSTLLLEEVRYIPELTRNLISLCTFEKHGYAVSLKNGRAKVVKGSRVILTGTRCKNNIYELDLKVEHGISCVVTSSIKVDVKLWHNRLGHIRDQGKSHRVKFPKGRHTSKRILDYIHAYLWGPARTHTIGGASYLLSLIDDYSRKGEVVTTTSYLINRSPSSAIGMKTPIEIWSGSNADCSEIRVFGSLAYSHVSQDKLGNRAEKCVFLGYPEGVKGYKLWRVESSKPRVIISRNGTFREDIMYKNIMRNKDLYDDRVNRGSEFEVEPLRYNSDKQDSDHESTHDQSVQDQVESQDQSEDSPRVNVRNPTYSIAKYRPRRQTVKLIRFRIDEDISAFVFLSVVGYDNVIEPSTYEEAISSKYRDQWVKAMKEEISSLHKNHTWVVTKKPVDRKIIPCKWLYKLKEPVGDDVLPSFKVRLVSKGFRQKEGIDYHEVFSPVVKHSSIRMLSITTSMDLELEQLDVKTAFLHGDLEEEIYIEQPKCFEEKGKEGQETKDTLMENFEMKELGPAKKILGMEIRRDRVKKELYLTQEGYVKNILQQYGMEGCKPITTPFAPHFKLSLEDCLKTKEESDYMAKVPYSNVVGSLMYLMVCTRPDISYEVSMVSRCLANPGKVHWETVKWLLRYLAGSQCKGLIFKQHSDSELVQGFVDSEYAKDADRGRSITGYGFLVLGNNIIWRASLQNMVALSSPEAEYIALVDALKEALWLKRFTR
ncbi:hypothetical protein SSX86_024987 [Deinandra increscens subsp. villosa]|uniref:Retrovirus-related Pol polyprotein from transposon TNT 1-94 n=1 Tax=Deinandra increscens subsp. villosa TaxID=3103831 RepID=A0AAP0CGV3_9ASTR